MTLKKSVAGDVRRNDDLLLALAKANEVKVSSIQRWIREDNKILTTVENLGIIGKHLGILDQAQLLEEETIEVGTTR
jgi:hypothetical protein